MRTHGFIPIDPILTGRFRLAQWSRWCGQAESVQAHCGGFLMPGPVPEAEWDVPDFLGPVSWQRERKHCQSKTQVQAPL